MPRTQRFPNRDRLRGMLGGSKNRIPKEFSGPEGLLRLHNNIKELHGQLLLRNLDSSMPSWLARTDNTTGQQEFDVECGYPREEELTPEYFSKVYRRWPLAARVVNIWPDESWAAPPEVYETDDPEPTEFEKAYISLNKKVLLDHYMHRVDRLSGVGEYGVLFFGYGDGRPLDLPVAGLNGKGEPTVGRPPKNELLYVRAFDQMTAKVMNLVDNPTSPMFGRPEFYEITFGGSPADSTGVGIGAVLLQKKVHWTRVQHLADNCGTCEWAGNPRMRNCIDELYNVRKVSGSSAEMFYKGGFPGYAFETYPDLQGDSTIDEDSLRETLYNYQRGLERFLATVGGTWKSLQPQVADPTAHVEAYGRLICTNLDVPMRIFFGTESGHLASTQDDHAWRTRCKGRQKKYLDPFVLRPLVNRLILTGVLPTPKDGPDSFKTEWQDLQTLSDKDRADVTLKRIQALALFKSGACEQIFPKRLLYTLLYGFTEDQAAAIEKELEASPPPKELTPEEMIQVQAEADAKVAVAGAKAAPKLAAGGGGRKGNPNARPAGRPPGKVEGKS
jgi:hypothetical protein